MPPKDNGSDADDSIRRYALVGVRIQLRTVTDQVRQVYRAFPQLVTLATAIAALETASHDGDGDGGAEPPVPSQRTQALWAVRGVESSTQRARVKDTRTREPRGGYRVSKGATNPGFSAHDRSVIAARETLKTLAAAADGKLTLDAIARKGRLARQTALYRVRIRIAAGHVRNVGPVSDHVYAITPLGRTSLASGAYASEPVPVLTKPQPAPPVQTKPGKPASPAKRQGSRIMPGERGGGGSPAPGGGSLKSWNLGRDVLLLLDSSPSGADSLSHMAKRLHVTRGAMRHRLGVRLKYGQVRLTDAERKIYEITPRGRKALAADERFPGAGARGEAVVADDEPEPKPAPPALVAGESPSPTGATNATNATGANGSSSANGAQSNGHAQSNGQAARPSAKPAPAPGQQPAARARPWPVKLLEISNLKNWLAGRDVLAVLAEGPSGQSTMHLIAKRLRVSHGGVTKRLQTRIDHGHVRRLDAKIGLYEITPAGRAALAQDRDSRVGAQAA